MKFLTFLSLVLFLSCSVSFPTKEVEEVTLLLCNGFSEFRNQKYVSSLVLYTPFERKNPGIDGAYFADKSLFCKYQVVARDSIVSILRAEKNLLKSNDSRLHLKVNEYLLKVPFDTINDEQLDDFLLTLNSETEYERIYHASNYILDLESGELEKILHHF